MIKRLVIAVLLLGLVVGGIVGFNLFRDKMIAQFFAGMTPPPVTVSVTEAKPITWQPGLDAVGTARAVNGADLSIEAAGVVKEILFGPNDEVAAGQALVQIDDRTEQADLAAAQSGLELARTELARTRTLQSRGVTATGTLDTAENAAREAEAQVEKLRAVLTQKRANAPFAGTIGIPRIETGEYVTAGTVYATLQDLSRMRVDFSLSEQDAREVKIGMPVTVSTEAGSASAPGRVTGIDPKIDPSSRLVTLRAVVENPDAALRPGQFVRARVILPEETGVIALPQVTVASNLYGDSVFIIRPAEKEGGPEVAQQVFVKLGRRSGELVEIVEGVQAGDRVVNAGQNRLSSNAAVKIDNSVAPVPGGVKPGTPANAAGQPAPQGAAATPATTEQD